MPFYFGFVKQYVKKGAQDMGRQTQWNQCQSKQETNKRNANIKTESYTRDQKAARYRDYYTFESQTNMVKSGKRGTSEFRTREEVQGSSEGGCDKKKKIQSGCVKTS